MATVYQAVQENLDREVALKIMSPTFVADKVLRESFITEGKIIASLSHPHIITIHDIGMVNHHYYMSMEYMPGETLRERIRDGLTTEQAILIIKQLAKALGYAHYRDFIHRDIKPGNVLFRHPAHAILTDFGVAKAQKTTSDLTRLGYMVGTPHYMSPEQANGKKLDHRSDLYSLGVLFYEMLTQSKPFTADDTLAIAYKHVNEPVPPLPPELSYLQGILDKLLAKDPRDRFPNTRVFITALEHSANDTTRIMPMPTHTKQSKSAGIGGTRQNQYLSHYPDKNNIFTNIIDQILSWFSSFKLFIQRLAPQQNRIVDDNLAKTIKQMQKRQYELEQQLRSHQSNTTELKKELSKANNGHHKVADKPAAAPKKQAAQNKSTKNTQGSSGKPLKSSDKKAPLGKNNFNKSNKPVSKTAPSAKEQINKLPPIDRGVSIESVIKQPDKSYTKHKEVTLPFPKLKEPVTKKQAKILILSPEINGTKNKLVNIEKTASILLLGQHENAVKSEQLHINQQLCRTFIDGYFCLKLHLDPNSDTKLTIKTTAADGDETTVTHKLKQIDLSANKRNHTHTPPTLTSMHNHALIVGNTHYEQFNDTPASTVDAHRLNKLFAGKFQYQTTCLLNATNIDILEGLNRIYTKFSKDDTLIIYYSGLSRYLEAEKEGYWIPVDADSNDKKTWFSHRYLAEILQLFPAKHILILTDSSFSAAQKQTTSLKKLLAGSKSGGNKSSGIVISSGSSSPQKSSAEKTRHSIFGGGLISILESTDKMVGSKELASGLKSHTNKFISDKKNKPQISYSILDGHKQKDNEFFLIPSRHRIKKTS